MPPARVWVRGVAGRLARIEPRGPFIPVDRWTAVPLSNFIQRKADVGDLELVTVDPDEPKKATPATIKEGK